MYLGCLYVRVYMGGHWLVSHVRVRRAWVRACVRAWGMGGGEGLVCQGVLVCGEGWCV